VTAKNRFAALACAGLLTPSLLLLARPVPISAQEEAPERKETPERPEREEPTLTPEQALAAIKRRAQRILEARRATRRFKFYAEVSEAVGYESNPATSSSRKGDTSFEQSGYFLVSKKLTPTIDWQTSYNPIYLKYIEYGEGDYFDNVLTVSKLRWAPGRMWRAESWIDLEYNYYPAGKDSTYRQFKTASRIRQNLFGAWFHQLQYEWFFRNYVRKNARDGAGNETLSNRMDVRYRLRHKAGFTVRQALPLKNALFTVENDLSSNDSNDATDDYYDYDAWKITGSVSGNATKKLYLSSSFAFERKNYRERPITSDVTPEARYDDKYTITGSASYDLDDTWRLTYDVSFDTLNSNHSPGEYDNTKNALKITARF